MKELIKYYYNIEVELISQKKDTYIIKSDTGIYVFKDVFRDKGEMEYIYSKCLENNVRMHEIIKNVDNLYWTKYKDKEYVLLKINDVKKIIEDTELENKIIYIEKVVVNKQIEKKIDLYQRQIHELGIDDVELSTIANYFIGLAETSATIYNEVLDTSEILSTIQRYRIYYPNFAINYYDPTNFIVDCRVRDMAEYYKFKQWNDKTNIEDILKNIEKKNFSIEEIKIFLARIIYPTVFFDYFEENILTKKDIGKLNYILLKTKEYNNFLYELMEELGKRYGIKKISWIKKELV